MNNEKWLYSLIAGLLFIALASPFAFHVTQTLIAKPLGYNFVSGSGPTTTGIVFHGIVFLFITRLMMD